MAEVTKLNIAEALVGSGHKFRKEMLSMPIAGIKHILAHASLRTGIRGKETVGSLKSGAQLRPYRTAKDATDTTKMVSRTLETFLMDLVEEFDPASAYDTVYGEAIAKNIKDLNIVKAVAMEIVRQCTENLGDAVFTAKYNAAGNTTMDGFNGLDTIIETAKTAGQISTAEKNLTVLEAITSVNAGDILLEMYRSLPKAMKRGNQKLTLYCPDNVKEAYDDWCLQNMGAVAYNTSFEKKVLHGTDGRLEIAGFSEMADVKNMFITPKQNVLIGCDQMSDAEDARIRECDNPKAVQVFMKMYFGTDFQTVDARMFHAYQLAAE